MAYFLNEIGFKFPAHFTASGLRHYWATVSTTDQNEIPHAKCAVFNWISSSITPRPSIDLPWWTSGPGKTTNPTAPASRTTCLAECSCVHLPSWLPKRWIERRDARHTIAKVLRWGRFDNEEFLIVEATYGRSYRPSTPRLKTQKVLRF